ncbi:MAG: hypothetical protein IPI67_32835 [Myxococcales bacterium]|nr:hypothetical protein [Myxococcales bacterium]
MRSSSVGWVFASVCVLLACGEDASSGGPGASGGSAGVGTGGASTGGVPSGGAGGQSGTGAAAGAAGVGASGGAGGSGGVCVDTCPAPNGGVTWNCKQRFLYGINYAWKDFAGDFGGISAWNIKGVAGQAGAHQTALSDMRAHGVSVVRWWMFPDFRGDGVLFDGSETPTGLGGTTLADIAKALELAEQADVYLMLTVFSFDNFKPSESVSGIWTPGITPIVKNASKRQALLDKVVRPVAKAVAASPYAKRVIAWDVINEPEWAMTGSDPYGDPAFEADSTLAPVSFTEMQIFISETVAVLRSESQAMVTVGGAAAKWAKAWSKVGLDFYQLHIYDWVDKYWPHTNLASSYGLDKPIVMGELPPGPLNGVPYASVVKSFWDNGYAGAMPWMYDGASAAELSAVKAFADTHTCETDYTQSAGAYVVTSPGSVVLPRAKSLRRCAVVAGRGQCVSIE